MYFFGCGTLVEREMNCYRGTRFDTRRFLLLAKVNDVNIFERNLDFPKFKKNKFVMMHGPERKCIAMVFFRQNYDPKLLITLKWPILVFF